ncbi:MAG TPA: helix-turn-helix domain-containing protein [Candidatus Acidoferrum sp.]|nr:helix-turn-helix domain-containing protein [Candidatus Acidoferrum sp.]
MADKKSKIQAADPGAEGAAAEPSLGQVITEARERKSLTREQVATEAHIPPHYVKMIETDSYDMISDRLYLVPFLRRYASFLGLDAEEIASRFVTNVQHAEANVVRMSQEITMVEKKPAGTRRIAFAVLVGAVVIVLADLAWRHFGEHEAPPPAPVSAPDAAPAEPKAQAPNENLPAASIVTNPEGAAPAANSQPPRAVPGAATDD